MKTRQEVYTNAKTLYAKRRCCPACNGLICRGETPGLGGKGSGNAFVRNAEMLEKVSITTNTISDNTEIGTTSEFFGHEIPSPVYTAPTNGILQNCGAELDDMSYTRALVDGCRHASTLAFTGDDMHDEMFKGPMSVVAQHEGSGVPTAKPWNREHMTWRVELAKEGHVLIIASDTDASGPANLRTSITPVGFKDVEKLKGITRTCGDAPFILEGMLSVKKACRALEAGISGITVSNHSGRALGDCLSGTKALEDIVRMVDERIGVFVDGMLCAGNDVFKALTLGADGVLIGRPISQAVIGDGSDGLMVYLEKIRLELKEVMVMAGCRTIQDMTKDCVSITF